MNINVEKIAIGIGNAVRLQLGLLNHLWVLVLLVAASPLLVQAQIGNFAYQHVIGTGDSIWDASTGQYVQVSACDSGALLDTGLKGHVCSINGDINTDGGFYHAPGGLPYRTFRREDPLPGQTVSFDNTVAPIGYPVLQPGTGDTFVTAYFTTPAGSQRGLYQYSYATNRMSVIADSTVNSVPNQPASRWTFFGWFLGVSPAGVFFKGSYDFNGTGTIRQGIYQYSAGQILELVGSPSTVMVPGRNAYFVSYGTITANSSTVFFVGEFIGGKGVYAYNLGTRSLTKVIDSSFVLGLGNFTDFAMEPLNALHGASIAANESGAVALVAALRSGQSNYNGMFLLTPKSGSYQIQLIHRSGIYNPALLTAVIQSYHTVTINSRSELAFVVANSDQDIPNQGLVFYRAGTLQSVFKNGDAFLAALKSPAPQSQTYAQGGIVSGSQALDSANPPHLFFRDSYMVMGNSTPFVMLHMATLNQ